MKPDADQPLLDIPATRLPAGAPDGGLDFGDLRRNTGFLLRMAWLQVREMLEQSSDTVGLTAAEYTILQMITQTPGVRQGHLARILYIKPAAMTRMIRDFEERGLIAREIPDKDRRTVRLSIRPAGRDALERARPLFGGMAEHERGHLTPAEQQHLNRLLRKFCGLSPSGTDDP